MIMTFTLRCSTGLVSHDDNDFHFEVLHGELQRGKRRCSEGVSRVADDKAIAKTLIENDLDGHAGISATDDSDRRELLADQRSALEGALLWPCCLASPETRIAFLKLGENLTRRTLHGGCLLSISKLLGFLDRET